MHWLETGLTVLCAVIASSGFWAWLSNRNNKKSASTQMILGLGHDRIICLCEKYIERGWISSDEYENLNTNPLFLSYFLNSYFNSASENILECNLDKVSINLPSNNPYLSYATLTLTNNIPHSLTYYDENNKPKLSIIYNKFSFESS